MLTQFVQLTRPLGSRHDRPLIMPPAQSLARHALKARGSIRASGSGAGVTMISQAFSSQKLRD